MSINVYRSPIENSYDAGISILHTYSLLTTRKVDDVVFTNSGTLLDSFVMMCFMTEKLLLIASHV